MEEGNDTFVETFQSFILPGKVCMEFERTASDQILSVLAIMLNSGLPSFLAFVHRLAFQENAIIRKLDLFHHQDKW